MHIITRKRLNEFTKNLGVLMKNYEDEHVPVLS